MTTDVIYVVWGPTAAWGDGSGPLGYFESRTDAESFIVEEKESVFAGGMADTWPYNFVDYDVAERSLDDLEIPGEVRVRGLEAVLEELNSF